MSNQREIKFRAWTEFEPEITKGSRRGEMSKSFGVLDDTREFSKNNILMQYTGLKDKNGVEIYEGDILADVDEPEPCIHKVYWENDALRFNILTLVDDEGNWDSGIYDELSEGAEKGKTKYFEVIGNIYENPELIKDHETN